MRYLVTSDIHGNAAALDTVLGEPHDAVICLGDIVGYGPEPAACVHRLLEEPVLFAVLGNHDRALIDGSDPRCRSEFRWLAEATASIAQMQLGEAERSFLRSLPERMFANLDDTRALCVHATPSDVLYRYLGPDADAWRAELAGQPIDLALVGHTHRQSEFGVDSQRVVNPGSVGQPKDGDPRAGYAVVEDGRVELKRMAYSVETTIAALERCGMDQRASAVMSNLLRTGRVPEHSC